MIKVKWEITKNRQITTVFFRMLTAVNIRILNFFWLLRVLLRCGYYCDLKFFFWNFGKCSLWNSATSVHSTWRNAFWSGTHFVHISLSRRKDALVRGISFLLSFLEDAQEFCSQQTSAGTSLSRLTCIGSMTIGWKMLKNTTFRKYENIVRLLLRCGYYCDLNFFFLELWKMFNVVQFRCQSMEGRGLTGSYCQKFRGMWHC